MKPNIFKLILALLSIALLVSCGTPTPVKPYVVYYKMPYFSSDFCEYQYYDVNGNSYKFYEKPNKYNIGDTIK